MTQEQVTHGIDLLLKQLDAVEETALTRMVILEQAAECGPVDMDDIVSVHNALDLLAKAIHLRARMYMSNAFGYMHDDRVKAALTGALCTFVGIDADISTHECDVDLDSRADVTELNRMFSL